MNNKISPFFTSNLISFKMTQELIWQIGISSEKEEVIKD